MGRALAAFALLALAASCARAPVYAPPISTVAGNPIEDVDDVTLAADVRHALARDDTLADALVSVDVTGGVVSLSGNVSSVPADRRAVAIAETVRGVRAVLDRLTVAPPLTPDREIKDNVGATLAADDFARSLGLRAEVRDGVVTLEGTVPSLAAKALVDDMVGRVPGVRSVDDRASVGTAKPPNDRELAAEARDRIKNDVLVDERTIAVGASGGVVELRGAVGSAAEKTRAVRDASIEGARAVDATGLAVQGWAGDPSRHQGALVQRPDGDLAAAVRDALASDPRTAASSITVNAEHGTVTLSGAARTLAAKRAALEDASTTVGVAATQDLVRVERGAALPSDAEIEDRVARALRRDVTTARDPIVVRSLSGTVELSGTVQTDADRARAEQIAAAVDGVLAVDNRLVSRRLQ